MSTDYQVLIQKFNNFKAYVAGISPNKDVIKEYEGMSESEMMLFVIGFLIPNMAKLDLIVAQMAQKIGLNNEDDKGKIKRYLECFIEYVSQINNAETLEKTILNVVNEKKIDLSQI